MCPFLFTLTLTLTLPSSHYIVLVAVMRPKDIKISEICSHADSLILSKAALSSLAIMLSVLCYGSPWIYQSARALDSMYYFNGIRTFYKEAIANIVTLADKCQSCKVRIGFEVADEASRCYEYVSCKYPASSRLFGEEGWHLAKALWIGPTQ